MGGLLVLATGARALTLVTGTSVETRERTRRCLADDGSIKISINTGLMSMTRDR